MSQADAAFSLAKAKADTKDGGYPSGLAYSNWSVTPVYPLFLSSHLQKKIPKKNTPPFFF